MRINLVMSGGGTRLPAYVGALRALRELGADVVRVTGASGGSIVAAFVAAGLTTEQCHDLAVDTDYRQFIDVSPTAMLTGHGLCAGRKFERWMDEQLRGARFRDLPMDLQVVATDILTYEPVIFSPSATPDASVAEAVRASMGIPGYFACHRWQGKLLVDGALCPEALWTLYDGVDDAHTTYVLLSTTRAQEVAPNGKGLWVWQYASRLLQTLMVALEHARVPMNRWSETTLINTGTLSGVDFHMAREQKLELVEQGYHQVKTHLTAKSQVFAKAPLKAG